MHEIRFRAWNKKHNMMCEVLAISFSSEDTVLKLGGATRAVPWTEVEFLQYTGLKDKNGKEIYEGDIVKVVPDEKQTMANRPHHDGLGFGGIADVRWNDVNLCWSLFPKGDLEETNMDYYGAWSDWNWLEIIGNIYENPELLGDTN